MSQSILTTKPNHTLSKALSEGKKRDHRYPNAWQNGRKEMSGSVAASASASAAFTAATKLRPSRNNNSPLSYCFHNVFCSSPKSSSRPRKYCVRVTNDSKRTELAPDVSTERSEGDKIVDGMDFGELCNEFECISSPLVEATARQLVRDILELREGNRALGIYATSVKYKSVQQMEMMSTSSLSIKWTLRGTPKSLLASVGGDLIVKINSKFTLNQISGQVIEHEELWDLSESSIFAQAYFWASRRIFATSEAGKDVAEYIKDLPNRFTKENKNAEIYPDPSGDPTKFFQRDDSFQRDVYQFALFVAILYFLVQFLRTTL